MSEGFSIAIHGGAGTIRQSEMTPEKEQQLQSTLQASIQAGIDILKNGGDAVSATTAAVVVMEDSPLFNAGKGSVFNHDGFIEMDASVMCGSRLDSGGVTSVRHLKNPVLVARKILTESRHCLLAGEGAERFAQQHGMAFENAPYFFSQFRWDQLQTAREQEIVQLDHSENDSNKFGTVGAVALDRQGNLAAATSTGGMTNKAAGRVGDSPLPGSGNYANNRTCAVSCTGIGEGFMRGVSAYDVSALIEYKGLSLKEAGAIVIHEKLPLVQGKGGLIAVDRKGEVTLPFNSEGMYRAWSQREQTVKIEMYR